MKKFLLLLTVLLLCFAIVGCGTIKSSNEAKEKYNMSEEVEFEEIITQEEMQKIVEDAINYIIENNGYQTNMIVETTRKNAYGEPYQSKIEEIYCFEEKNGKLIENGYVYEENIDNDGEIVEYFCKDSFVYYYNHNTGTKAIREYGCMTTYLNINILELLADLNYDENDQYGIDKNGNTVMIAYCELNDILYEMRLVFKDNKLIHYAYEWVHSTNKYIDIYYKKSSEIEIKYPNLEEFD